MFNHAYDGYLKYAYPYDELRPLSCDGVDTWGSYSLTLIDALDTLAIMGNYTEFQRVVKILTSKANFDANINVSVFETNIRIIGGLISAHLLSHRAGVDVEPGWPCNGPLLRLAEDVAKRLITAFDTRSGMPYGTVNLRHGVPVGETAVTCTAGIGTFILEFGTLSRLTGDPLYEEVAMNAIYSLYQQRSHLGLYGNHIDVLTGHWTAQDAGIGAAVDSYFEYLVKGSILLQKPELMKIFWEARRSIDKYLKREDWYLWVSMTKGQVTLPVFQSLEAYWPGVLSLIGDTSSAMKTLHNYHQVWQQYGFTPEFYNIAQAEAGADRENYPLRPELIESIMYLYRATGDPQLISMGVDILRSIQHSAKTPCGYATIKDVRDHRKEDRMESFFLAETTKYLYLLFDTENFIHNQGDHGVVVNTPNGECIIEAGGYIFNTEAHPIDPSALYCCHDKPKEKLFNFDSLKEMKQTFRGETLQERKTSFIPPKENCEELADDTQENIQVEVKSIVDNISEILSINKGTVEVLDDNLNTIVRESFDEIKLAEADEIEIKGTIEVEAQTQISFNDSLFREDLDKKIYDLIPSILPNVTVQAQVKHDPQLMLERIRIEKKHSKYSSWQNEFNLLTCKAQPFLQRLSIMGEFFKS
ncbi:ER degradation-enhancing alpha-mannosidase-like protein 2 isoform X2 [Photinus pyralis]|nr:ER degradation-enhancing alpha-mannosidase-like protein 2 isoform X2 [Photinus pyralis]